MFATGVATATQMSPLDAVRTGYNIVYVEDGCTFSEIVTECLATQERPQGETPALVAVPTSPVGDLGEAACMTAQALARQQPLGASTALALWTAWSLPTRLWCRLLASEARAWLSEHGGLRWPVFERGKTIVGVGMLSAHLIATGEPAVAARLATCVDQAATRRRLNSHRESDAP